MRGPGPKEHVRVKVLDIAFLEHEVEDHESVQGHRVVASRSEARNEGARQAIAGKPEIA